MRLHAFHIGGEIGDWSLFDPFDARIGTSVEIPYFAYLIEHPSGYVLFDTGAHPDLGTDPRGRLGAAAETFEIRMSASDNVGSALATFGVDAHDVKHVVLSHLHYDHAGGIGLLPNATFYVQKLELPFAHWPPVYQRAIYVRQDFDLPVRWRALSGQCDLFNDGSLIVFPTPGHTPGHQSLLAHLGTQSVILLGDAAYHPQKMRDRILPALLWNPDALIESWDRIDDLQRQHNAQLVFTHDPDFATSTKIAPEAWYE
jgi:glyoxylase-like metal-dependent hydrolase (beta-lactamase superfamily II)